jgi:hypothetical protein
VGGIAVQVPLAAVRTWTVNGKRVSASGGEVIVRQLPATVLAQP